jgi:group I intron endonuclease
MKNIIFTHKKSNTRYFQTTSIKPIIIYDNTDQDKEIILKNSIAKAGVYRWVNKLNGKTYIGSATDLRTRFYVYFSAKRLIDSKMAIYKAILKHGYSNFRLEILEYCDVDKTLTREHYYLDLLKPEYNVLTKAGSSFGYKHSQETLDKFKLRVASSETRANLSKSAQGRVLSEETKKKISWAHTGKKLSMNTRAKLSDINTASHGLAVIISNIETGETKEYVSLTDAGIDLDVSRTTIANNIKLGKILKNKYIIILKE